MGSAWLLTSGDYSINGFRFYYNPQAGGIKSGGQDIDLLVAKIETFSAVILQAWEPTAGSKIQKFTWNFMNSEFFDALDTFWASVKTSPDTTHTMVFHNRSPEETWTIHIDNFSFDSLVQGVYRKVELSFTLLQQVV